MDPEQKPMTASIPIPFPLNEPCWCVGPGHHEVRETCPECAGTKRVTLVQGNGQQFSLPCNRCGPGYNEPTGLIIVSRYEHRPERFVPRRVRVEGDEIAYSAADPGATAYNIVYAQDMFATEEECRLACEAHTIQLRADMEKREAACMENRHRSLAHSVSYYQGIIRRAEREIEIAAEKLGIAREKLAKRQGKK